MQILGYDATWFALSALLLVCGVHVTVSRQLLALFSRKRLLEIAGGSAREQVEASLDREDAIAASLRGLDLTLRLLVILFLAFGRVVAMGAWFADRGFFAVLAESVLLAVEIAVVFAVFLEILPGILARTRLEERLLARLGILRAIDSCIGPVRSIAGVLVRWGVAVLGGKTDRPSADVLEEEILTVAEEGEREGLLASGGSDMIESILSFGGVEVSAVMTPRTEMVGLDVDDPLEVNLRLAVECGHSRIPVYRGSKDDIIGLLYVKDLLRYWERKETISLKDILRKPHFVPLSKKIGDLFQEFKTLRFHIAIILDEFGGTAGLVTIEDIIEEIVGEITDEYDRLDGMPLRKLSSDEFEVDGASRIDELNDKFSLGIPEGDTYDTVSGYLVSQTGHIPSAGDSWDSGDLHFEVVASDERRIRRVRIRRRPAPPDATDTASA